MTLRAHGCPVQAIVAAFGLDERTVARYQAEAGAQCRRVHERVVQAGRVPLGQGQADELRVAGGRRGAWVATALAVAPAVAGRGGQRTARQAADPPAAGARARLRPRRGGACGASTACTATSPRRGASSASRRAPGVAGARAWSCRRGCASRRWSSRTPAAASSGWPGGSCRAPPKACRRGSPPPRAGRRPSAIPPTVERRNATFRARLAPLVRRARPAARHAATVAAGRWLVGACDHFCWPHDSLRMTRPGTRPARRQVARAHPGAGGRAGRALLVEARVADLRCAAAARQTPRPPAPLAARGGICRLTTVAWGATQLIGLLGKYGAKSTLCTF